MRARPLGVLGVETDTVLNRIPAAALQRAELIVTIEPPRPARTGLAVCAATLGGLAVVLLAVFYIVGKATQGQGLGTGTLVVLFSMPAATVFSLAGIVVGGIALAVSRQKLWAWVGLVLGAVTLVLVIVLNVAQVNLS